MTFEEYLNNLGFIANPFQYTNADKEKDKIEEYFVEPNYFEDMWGDPYNPISTIVYAPRGGGKTAQRIMIEKRALDYNNILTITYTNHDLTSFKNAIEVSSNYHLSYLNSLLLIAFFNELSKIDSLKANAFLDFTERQFLYKLARIYIYDTPVSFPSQAISSIKHIEDYAVDLWRNFKEPISNVIKQLTASKGIEVDLSNVELDEKLALSHKENLKNIIYFLKKTGIDCTYVLIDKVDETSLTGNDPEASYQLIDEIIKDLELLETEGIAFKFFLWDALYPYAVQHARPDRIYSYSLKWSIAQITEMLDKRINTFSRGKLNKFTELVDDKKGKGRIILFSQFSPRDCIRICNRALSEQFRKNPKSFKIELETINEAITYFARKEKSVELIQNESNRRYLAKMNSTSFTIEELVNGKVASNNQAVRNFMAPWQKAEYVKKIGLVERKNKRAVNEYAFEDLRLAFYSCANMDIDEFLEKKLRRCQNCKTFYYRDFDKKRYPCPECQTDNE